MGIMPRRGRANWYKPGDNNANCALCGFVWKAHDLIKYYKGGYVCPVCYEEKHPQDFRLETKQIPLASPPAFTQRTPLDYSFGPQAPLEPGAPGTEVVAVPVAESASWAFTMSASKTMFYDAVTGKVFLVRDAAGLTKELVVYSATSFQQLNSTNLGTGIMWEGGIRRVGSEIWLGGMGVSGSYILTWFTDGGELLGRSDCGWPGITFFGKIAETPDTLGAVHLFCNNGVGSGSMPVDPVTHTRLLTGADATDWIYQTAAAGVYTIATGAANGHIDVYDASLSDIYKGTISLDASNTMMKVNTTGDPTRFVAWSAGSQKAFWIDATTLTSVEILPEVAFKFLLVNSADSEIWYYTPATSETFYVWNYEANTSRVDKVGDAALFRSTSYGDYAADQWMRSDGKCAFVQTRDYRCMVVPFHPITGRVVAAMPSDNFDGYDDAHLSEHWITSAGVSIDSGTGVEGGQSLKFASGVRRYAKKTLTEERRESSFSFDIKGDGASGIRFPFRVLGYSGQAVLYMYWMPSGAFKLYDKYGYNLFTSDAYAFDTYINIKLTARTCSENGYTKLAINGVEVFDSGLQPTGDDWMLTAEFGTIVEGDTSPGSYYDNFVSEDLTVY